MGLVHLNKRLNASRIVSHTNNRPSHRQNSFHSGGVPRRRMLLPGKRRRSRVGAREGMKKVPRGKERAAVGGGTGSAKVHCHGRCTPRWEMLYSMHRVCAMGNLMGNCLIVNHCYYKFSDVQRKKYASLICFYIISKIYNNSMDNKVIFLSFSVNVSLSKVLISQIYDSFNQFSEILIFSNKIIPHPIQIIFYAHSSKDNNVIIHLLVSRREFSKHAVTYLIKQFHLAPKMIETYLD